MCELLLCCVTTCVCVAEQAHNKRFPIRRFRASFRSNHTGAITTRVRALTTHSAAFVESDNMKGDRTGQKPASLEQWPVTAVTSINPMLTASEAGTSTAPRTTGTPVLRLRRVHDRKLVDITSTFAAARRLRQSVALPDSSPAPASGVSVINPAFRASEAGTAMVPPRFGQVPVLRRVRRVRVQSGDAPAVPAQMVTVQQATTPEPAPVAFTLKSARVSEVTASNTLTSQSIAQLSQYRTVRPGSNRRLVVQGARADDSASFSPVLATGRASYGQAPPLPGNM